MANNLAFPCTGLLKNLLRRPAELGGVLGIPGAEDPADGPQPFLRHGVVHGVGGDDLGQGNGQTFHSGLEGGVAGQELRGLPLLLLTVEVFLKPVTELRGHFGGHSLCCVVPDDHAGDAAADHHACRPGEEKNQADAVFDLEVPEPVLRVKAAPLPSRRFRLGRDVVDLSIQGNNGLAMLNGDVCHISQSFLRIRFCRSVCIGLQRSMPVWVPGTRRQWCTWSFSSAASPQSGCHSCLPGPSGSCSAGRTIQR